MDRIATLMIVVSLFFYASLIDIDSEENGFCRRMGDNINCVREENLTLTRLVSEEVGEITDMTMSDGKILRMVTVCMKPLVFEIEDFLSSEECDHFIETAKQTGLETSRTYSDDASLKDGITLYDINQDGLLTLQEMKLTIKSSFDIYPNDDDLITMYHSLDIDKNNDKQISREELSKIKPSQLTHYLKEFVKTNPTKHSRYSAQAWLFPDSSTDLIFSAVQQRGIETVTCSHDAIKRENMIRVSELVQLPLDLIKLSDFQVVQYGVHGHYNAHIDSSHEKPGVPCCERNAKQTKCRICRYMTVLFYLSDVTKGGETAFPLANNETIDQTIVHLDNVGHLFEKCDTANLRINARKGKAVVWYNHFLNEETGWMGEVDEHTFHGGCPVLEGEKWIANFWIKTNPEKEKDIKKMRKVAKAAKAASKYQKGVQDGN